MGNVKYSTKDKKNCFSNGYQPKYINDKKLKQVYDSDIPLKVAGLDDKIIGYLESQGVKQSQSVWEADGKYWVWIGKTKSYACIGSVD